MKRLLALIALGGFGCGGEQTGSGPAPASTGGPDPKGQPAMAMDECKLDTGYAGDEHCILPPPSDKGFQVHYGPTDYDNPESDFVLMPGDERTTTFPATSGNDEKVFFYYRQYRMRTTAHHIILSVPNANSSVLSLGRRVGTANRSQDFPAGGVIAPEDQTVGIPLDPHTVISASFHAINTSNEPALREAWINFWYRDPNEITQPATEWFKVGDVTFSVPPHESTVLGPYMCTVDGDGRMLWLYGHRHANNTRFTVSRVRGDQREVIYDSNIWEEPLLLEFNSNVKNPTPDLANGVEGGWSGILDLLKGDQIEWSCDVTNNHDTALRFTDQTLLGEMCIVDAEAVNSNCSGL
jgi:hypothetical protein